MGSLNFHVASGLPVEAQIDEHVLAGAALHLKEPPASALCASCQVAFAGCNVIIGAKRWRRGCPHEDGYGLAAY